MLIRLWRIVKLGGVNFIRNWSLSLAAVLIISLTLLVITLFLAIRFTVVNTAQAVEQKIDLKAYFADNVSLDEIQELRFKIKSRFNVTSITFIDKDEALRRWKARSINQKIKDLITREDNPLPRTLEIKSPDPRVLEQITQVLTSKAYQGKIYRVTFQQNKPVIERMFKVTRLVVWSVGILAGILILISVVVIYNTIRLTIFSRQEEVKIMELVGASGAFVRLPFIIEALWAGVLAVLLVLAILFLGFKLAAPIIINQLDFGWFDIKENFYHHLGLIIAVQVMVGILITVLSSWISVRKYLK